MRRWRPLYWFSLVVILSSTPAREAEAASDLARTIAEVDGGDDRRVEEVDGGVGDDSLEATRADAPAQEAMPGHPGFEVVSVLPTRDFAPALERSRPVPAAPTHPPGRSGRRQAWLGRFRF